MSSATLSPTAEIPLLRQHLRKALFISEIKAKRKASVLEEMVAVLATADVTRHPEGVLDAVRRRETLGSTGLGKGIAVPHARSTLITERSMVIARSTKGIDFDSPDGQPTHLCFLIVAPPLEVSNQYLPVLGKIAQFSKESDVPQRLLGLTENGQFLKLLEEKGV